MAIVKRVVLSQLEAQPNGTVQVRLDKQVVEGDTVLAREYHRTVIEPGTKAADQMAFVNAHLAGMGWPPVASTDVDRIAKLAKAWQTPDLVKAYQAAQKAAAASPG